MTATSGEHSDPFQPSVPVLTIGIPTYNRSKYLDRCLKSILDQATPELVPLLRIYVSDNASEDDTGEVVKACSGRGVEIVYQRNSENLGADGNFIKIIQGMAETRYWMLLGDDDWLVSGGLLSILSLLQSQPDLGGVLLECRPRYEQFIYSEKCWLVGQLEFVRQVNHHLTFISCLIFPHSALLKARENLEDCRGTCLQQLGWVLPQVTASESFAIIGRVSIGAEPGNTGGYGFTNTFIWNFWGIWRNYMGQNYPVTKWLRFNMMLFFYQGFIMEIRTGQGNSFAAENNFQNQFNTEFGREFVFYLLLKPILVWPIPLAKLWFKICGGMRLLVYLREGRRFRRLERDGLIRVV